MNTEPEGKLLGDNNNVISDLNNDSKELDNSAQEPFSIPIPTKVRLETPIKYRFKVLLQRLGQSQNWLANQCDVSTATMSQIANGKWFPSSKLMTHISELLEVQSHVLFGDSELWKQYHEDIVYPKDGEE